MSIVLPTRRILKTGAAILICAVLVFAAWAPVHANPAAEPQDPAPASPIPAEPIAAPATPAPLLVVRSFSTTPERILAGDPFALRLSILNTTARRAENVLVSIAGPGAAAEGGGGGLAVLGTGNAKHIGALRGQRQADVTFDVITTPGVSAGALNVPVNISFEYDGARHEVAYTIGLMVERVPVLSLVTAEVPSKVVAGEDFTTNFELANASAFELKAAKLSVEASGATITDGSWFIGNFGPATTELIESIIRAEEPGELEVVLVLEYRDDFGQLQSHRETRTVTVEKPAAPEEVNGEAEDPAAAQEENWFIAFIRALFGLGG